MFRVSFPGYVDRVERQLLLCLQERREREVIRETDGEIGRHTQTDRKVDRQIADRHRHTEKNRGKEK